MTGSARCRPPGTRRRRERRSRRLSEAVPAEATPGSGCSGDGAAGASASLRLLAPGPADGDFGPRTRTAVEVPRGSRAEGYDGDGGTDAGAGGCAGGGGREGGGVGTRLNGDPGRRFRDCAGSPGDGGGASRGAS